LSARLNPQSGRARIGVLNQSIGCTRVLSHNCGPNGSARFDRDVLSQTGLTHVIVAMGLVDIAFPTVVGNPAEVVSADEVMTGLRQLAERARVKGIKVYGVTLTPNEGSTFPNFFTPENEVKRQAVNNWIRTSGTFDAVIDVDKVVRDPAQPSRLLRAYAIDDLTHLNDAGHAAIGNSISLALFP
jgi:lysophospholipase L1-like esterase